MGDPSFGSSPPADSEVDSQSPFSLLAGIRPFLQAPPPSALPGPMAFVPSLPLVPHAEAQGQPPLALSTDGLSYQVSPLSVGQPPCSSTMSFAPSAIIPLSGQFAPLPRGSSVISHAGMSSPPPVVVSRPLSSLSSSPLCLTLGPRAEAFTSTSLGSPHHAAFGSST